MSTYKNLMQDVDYKCNHHIALVPKYRFRVLYGTIKSLAERAFANHFWLERG